MVEPLGINVTSGGSNQVIFAHDNLDIVLLDTAVATVGTLQAGLHAESSVVVVNLGRCTLTGSPELSVGTNAFTYVGRGAINQMELLGGASIDISGVTPDSTQTQAW